jgi:hypothetical protein
MLMFVWHVRRLEVVVALLKLAHLMKAAMSSWDVRKKAK